MDQTSGVCELERLLEEKSDILLVGHFNPDGDSIGSMVAMHSYLDARGIRSTMVVPSSFPEFLHFLDPENEIRDFVRQPDAALKAIEGSDLFICLDFNSMSRVEGLEGPIRRNGSPRVVIDHHLGPELSDFVLAFSKSDISSACEVLFEVLMKMPDIDGKVSNLPARCIEALYTGMMTDTNNYANSVFPSTMDMASMLLRTGLDKEKIQSAVFDNFSESRMHLMGYMLQKKMTVLPEQHTAYMILTKSEKDRFNYKEGDTEGFVNLPFAIRGVLVTALFTESDSFIRVSLRSKCSFSVNEFSKAYFNGGGHAKASGGRLYMPIEAIPHYFEKSIEKFIASYQGTPFDK
ncbi:MAG: DHH family phosphoesterase [Bacteroidales bacterium]|jgi:phosphoesterase RecJ-like protein|nr:DHH family phosphoesterase [Bacteroidales bacterium]MCI2122495.1 DHH family phosphoesterase [Bacteroidales bacterium]MCI2145476.1 DHH family phosphoesterase [Bacteroidales bacterium]